MHSLHRTGGCSELKFYFLLDCSDSWELGPKLAFRGSDPPLVFLTCVFSLALWILVVCSSCLCFVNRVDLGNKSFYSGGINCAALYTWILVRLYIYFHFLRGLLACGKIFFRGEYLLLLLSIKKNVEAGDANVGFPLLKWFVQTVFLSLTWKPSGPFETILTHCSRFSGVFGKMIPPSLLLHVPFLRLFRIPWLIVAASSTPSIYWHNWAIFFEIWFVFWFSFGLSKQLD